MAKLPKVPTRVREQQYACWKNGVDYPHSAILMTVPWKAPLHKEAREIAAAAQSYTIRAASK